MLYSQDDINNIHSSYLAIEGTVYTDYDGIQYIGMSTGRLALYTPPPETVTIVQEPVQVEAVEDEVTTDTLSYFEPKLDDTFQLVLQPIDPIETILFNNVFVLDTTEGVLMPTNNISDTDIYWEIESGGACITPKDNITL
jgi:hypothetical protein